MLYSWEITHKFPELAILGGALREWCVIEVEHPSHRSGNEWRVARAGGRCKPRVPQITPARWGSIGTATRAVTHLLTRSSTSHSRHVRISTPYMSYYYLPYVIMTIPTITFFTSVCGNAMLLSPTVNSPFSRVTLASDALRRASFSRFISSLGYIPGG